MLVGNGHDKYITVSYYGTVLHLSSYMFQMCCVLCLPLVKSKDLETPAGTWVRVWRVGVRVWNV